MYSSSAVAVATCSVVFPALSCLAVGLRFQARRISSLTIELDDYSVLIALLLVIAEGCLVLHGSCRASIGKSLLEMTPADYAAYQKHLYFDAILVHLSIGITKLSVLFFYKRIFNTRTFRRWANGVMAFVILWLLGSFFTQVFSAWPISNLWNLRNGYLFNYGAFITAFAAMDIALDIIILCLPIPVIRGLNMSTRRKFTLVGIFWLGAFCVVSAAVRLYFAHELSPGSYRFMSGPHILWSSTGNVIWCLIEPCASIVAACLPTYGPLIRNGLWVRRSAQSVPSAASRTTPFHSSGQTSSNALWARRPSNGHQKGDSWTRLKGRNQVTAYGSDVELGCLQETGNAVHVGTHEFSEKSDGYKVTTRPSRIHVSNTVALKTEPRAM